MNYLMWAAVLVIVTTATPAVAEVYRYLDKNGNVTFSDEPRKGAETVKVRPVTTVTLPKMKDVEARARQPEAEEKTQAKPYDAITFDAPEDGTAFYSGNGDIELRVSSSPALKKGHRFEVDIDGQPVGQNPSGSFTVRNIDRGTHNASAFVVDSKGQRIQSGSRISFTLHRPSVINQNRSN
ncbi:DUF4124 domain-containing protein [Marinobacter caseinilyticus]|uniref:DUF4124 domain-containing protein n=1 Tax=Marinobacter caseinilyticus TaxID=2692195 RepID=UPI001408E060|nr:DUF4124 domain-containing protein [Marinobacter caseinilyticus]